MTRRGDQTYLLPFTSGSSSLFCNNPGAICSIDEDDDVVTGPLSMLLDFSLLSKSVQSCELGTGDDDDDDCRWVFVGRSARG
jgi:hypothetical protein